MWFLLLVSVALAGAFLIPATAAAQDPALTPANVSPPTISGTPAQGETLSADPGSWSGTEPLNHAYQWQRCALSLCSDILGADQQTYTLSAVDAGAAVQVRVTTSNAAGASSATSNATAPVAARATFTPVADAYVSSADPEESYGSSTTLRVDGEPPRSSYVRFDVEIPAGATVTGATLDVYTTSDASGRGYFVANVASTDWDEASLTYRNAPALGSQIAGSGGWFTPGYKSATLPPSSVAAGLNSFGLGTASPSSKLFDSREATNKPRLVVTYTLPPLASPAPEPSPPPAPLLPASGALFGAWHKAVDSDRWSQDDYAEFEDLVGRKMDINHRYHVWGTRHWPGGNETWDAASGRINMLSLGGGRALPNLDSILDGSQDDFIAERADAVKAFGAEMFFRPWWGMNDSSGAYWQGAQNNETGQADGPTKFVRAWRHVHDIFVQRGATNAVWVWSPSCKDSPAEPWNHWSNYYPGDAYVDWVACEGFNRGASHTGSEWESWARMFGGTPSVYDDYPGKPFMAAATASCEEGGDKQAWIGATHEDIRSSFPNLKAIVWFDESKECDWRAASSPGALEAFRTMAADSYFQGPVSTPAPDTTAPATPSELSATAGDGQVALDWVSNSEPDLASYRIYRQDADGTWPTSPTATVEATSHTDDGLAKGTSYTYRVTAVDSAGNESAPSASATATTAAAPAPGGDPVIAGAGDIATSGQRDEATAKLLDAIDPDAVFTLGDNAYPDGTPEQFTNYYEPTWGRHKSKTKPTPGNHEYHSGGTGYFDYYGELAGERGKGYYSYDLGEWHLIALNSNIDRGIGSAQEAWLRSDLQSNSKPCTLAYWHHPRWNVGTKRHDSSQAALWNALYDYGADVVLVGHDHNYQRYYRLDKGGKRDDALGIRQFTVGTGGASHYGVSLADPAEVMNSDTSGVLKLTLHSSSYDWQFVPEAGRTFTDSGSESCHGKPAVVPPPSDPSAGKTLSWADEFNSLEGSPPDTANWVHDRGGHGWGNSELQCYTTRPENSTHDGQGNLQIIARQESYDCGSIVNQYTSARLKTKGKREFQYGYVEGRIKVPPGQGIWPAFWTLGGDFSSVGWPASGEIDILEVIGRQPTSAFQTIHGPTLSEGHWKLPFRTTGPAWHDEFHTYGVEWSEDRITFYIDGVATRTFTSSDLEPGWQWSLNKPQFLLLNVAVGGEWPGDPDPSTPFPATMLVDYVRVYQ